jgi:hypothetical protein
MNTAVQRKAATSSRTTSGSDLSSAADVAEEKYKEPVFRHGELLIMSLAPAVLVMLAFGGKPSLVAICFGSLFSYIFDILGAMEVNVLCSYYIFLLYSNI